MITTVGCSICQDSFNDNRTSVVTKCGHVFHLGCVQEWIDLNHTCPSCRSATSQTDLIRVFFSPVMEDGEAVVDLLNRLEQAECRAAVFSSRCDAKKREEAKNNEEMQSVIENLKSQKLALENAERELKKEIRQLGGKLKQMEHNHKNKIGFLYRQIDALKSEIKMNVELIQAQKRIIEVNDKMTETTKAEFEERISQLNAELNTYKKEAQSKNQQIGNVEKKLRLPNENQQGKGKPVQRSFRPARN